LETWLVDHLLNNASPEFTAKGFIVADYAMVDTDTPSALGVNDYVPESAN
jgi:hypothetical protein